MSNCVTYAFLYEKLSIDFSETIAACDLKDGRCIQLILSNDVMQLQNVINKH